MVGIERNDRKQNIACRLRVHCNILLLVVVDLRLLGAAVRRARKDRGLTLRVLAESAGLSERFLSDLEAGRGNIAITRLAAVAEVLDVPLAALVASLEA